MMTLALLPRKVLQEWKQKFIRVQRTITSLNARAEHARRKQRCRDISTYKNTLVDVVLSKDDTQARFYNRHGIFVTLSGSEREIGERRGRFTDRQEIDNVSFLLYG